MKRFICAVIVAMLVILSAVPAFAHGGHHSKARSVNYSLCTVRDCVQTNRHIHSGKVYNGHYNGDGHIYHHAIRDHH